MNAKDRDKVSQRIVSGQWDKYVYLPQYRGLKAAIADLQNLYTIKLDVFLNEYTRVATISSPFLKDIQSRFSSYYGRQGQPDMDKKKFILGHKAALAPPAT